MIPPPGGGVTPGATLTSGSASTSLRRRVLQSLSPSNTPGLYRLLLAVSALACALFAIVGSSGFSARGNALGDASRIADELINVQQARSAAAQADAIASTAYLAGGERQGETRAKYVQLLDTAAARITAAAVTATPDEQAQLQAAASSLVTYGGLIEQAQANNRQGHPLGASYQRVAAETLETATAVPLDAVEASSRNRLNDAIASAAGSTWRPVLFGLLALGSLVVSLWMLLRKTNRLINLPVLIGAVIVAVALLAAASTLGSSSSDVRRTVEGALQDADGWARVSTAVADSRAAESLRLINRGNGSSYEAKRSTAIAVALELTSSIEGSCEDSCVGTGLSELSYEQGQRLTREENGDWDGAVETAARAGAYEPLMIELDSRQGESIEQARLGLDNARSPLGAMRVVLLLAGLVAALLAAVGFGQRLKEYR